MWDVSTVVNNTLSNDYIKQLSHREELYIFIAGDFNYPTIKWNAWHVRGLVENQAQLFLDALQDSFLFRHVTRYTRFREGQLRNILDLVITNDQNIVKAMVMYYGI